MSEKSRTRQRECLAQRGKRRKGGDKVSVRNYVAELGNNRWMHKYPARLANWTRGQAQAVLVYDFFGVQGNVCVGFEAGLDGS